MVLLVWLVAGACAGSLVAMFTRQGFGLAVNVALGIAGALIGGMACAMGDIANCPLTVTTLFVPMIGAAAVPAIANAVRAGAIG